MNKENKKLKPEVLACFVKMSYLEETGPNRLMLKTESGVEMSIARRGNKTIIGISGSSDLDDWIQNILTPKSSGIYDWIQNIRIWPTYAMGLGIVHRGFYIGARDAIREMLLMIDFDDSIYIGGHSKGGVEALIIGWILKQRGFDVRQISTFGAPQGLSASAAKKICSEIEVDQYAINGDAVPRLPSNRFSLYQHTDNLHRLRAPRKNMSIFEKHDIETYIEVLGGIEYGRIKRI